MPRLATADALTASAEAAGFAFVRRQFCPHDRRPGAERFPKMLLEFWRREPGRGFPAVAVVSPAHRDDLEDIVQQLRSEGLEVAGRHPVHYSDDLIRTIYERCPWREPLLRFVGEASPGRTATALAIAGDPSTPDRLARLGEFKRTNRARWRNIVGPEAADGFRAMILPFHVAEPYEAEALIGQLGLPSPGVRA